MVVYVDMSAKVEDWNADSAVAVSNGISHAYLIPAKVKQNARRLVTELYSNKSVTYRLFALFIYIAVKDNLRNVRQIVIDKDYSGEAVEVTIKNLLLNLLRRNKPDTDSGFIRFANVKDSRADILAREAFQRKVTSVKVVTWSEIETIILRK